MGCGNVWINFKLSLSICSLCLCVWVCLSVCLSPALYVCVCVCTCARTCLNKVKQTDIMYSKISVTIDPLEQRTCIGIAKGERFTSSEEKWEYLESYCYSRSFLLVLPEKRITLVKGCHFVWGSPFACTLPLEWFQDWKGRMLMIAQIWRATSKSIMPIFVCLGASFLNQNLCELMKT